MVAEKGCIVIPRIRKFSNFFSQFLQDGSSAPIVFVRLGVGLVFLSEGMQKFLFPAILGVGRFAKIGIPYPEIMAYVVGVLEIGGGIFLLVGLLTRIIAIPMLINMIVAISSTKLKVLAQEGFWRAAHESRTDFLMISGIIFLLFVGAGKLSLDALFYNKLREKRHVSP